MVVGAYEGAYGAGYGAVRCIGGYAEGEYVEYAEVLLLLPSSGIGKPPPMLI